jgi:hypothetical protein
MRTPDARHLFLACIAACATPIAAWAQPAGNDAPPPPQLQKLEEGEPPAVTIRKPESNSEITEKRAPGGKVTEVKVITGKSTYYLKPNDPAGNAMAGDAEANPNRGAQWEVKEFDLGQRAQKKKEEEAAQQTPAPPAAPAAPVKK